MGHSNDFHFRVPPLYSLFELNTVYPTRSLRRITISHFWIASKKTGNFENLMKRMRRKWVPLALHAKTMMRCSFLLLERRSANWFTSFFSTKIPMIWSHSVEQPRLIFLVDVVQQIITVNFTYSSIRSLFSVGSSVLLFQWSSRDNCIPVRRMNREIQPGKGLNCGIWWISPAISTRIRISISLTDKRSDRTKRRKHSTSRSISWRFALNGRQTPIGLPSAFKSNNSFCFWQIRCTVFWCT